MSNEQQKHLPPWIAGDQIDWPPKDTFPTPENLCFLGFFEIKAEKNIHKTINFFVCEKDGNIMLPMENATIKYRCSIPNTTDQWNQLIFNKLLPPNGSLVLERGYKEDNKPFYLVDKFNENTGFKNYIGYGEVKHWLTIELPEKITTLTLPLEFPKTIYPYMG